MKDTWHEPRLFIGCKITDLCLWYSVLQCLEMSWNRNFSCHRNSSVDDDPEICWRRSQSSQHENKPCSFPLYSLKRISGCKMIWSVQNDFFGHWAHFCRGCVDVVKGTMISPQVIRTSDHTLNLGVFLWGTGPGLRREKLVSLSQATVCDGLH